MLDLDFNCSKMKARDLRIGKLMHLIQFHFGVLRGELTALNSYLKKNLKWKLRALIN